MASSEQVKQYIASWLQLGRSILVEDNGDTRGISAAKVIEGDRYTQDFEEIWQLISTSKSDRSYLQGTNETVAQLLAPSWEIVHCSLCNMLIALPQVGAKAAPCPCHDLSGWPDNNLPIPTGAHDSQFSLQKICQRLNISNTND